MFVSGSSTWCHSEILWQGYSHVWTIKWWPVVRGARRHSCIKDRSLFSPKGYKNDRRLMKVLEWRSKEKERRILTRGLIVLLLYLIFYWLVYLNELTLSVCVWRWLCNLLHGNSCWCRWADGCIETEWGTLGDFLTSLFYWTMVLL